MISAPDLQGVVDRRLLLNFRVDPEIARRLVPAPFRPNLSRGAAIAGICVIRLTELRPSGVPRALGIRSESAAHRFAVEWDSDDGEGHGVYIPRRDTDSRLGVLLGGRAFPGVHHHASFHVRETPASYDIDLRSPDPAAPVSVRATGTDALPAGSIFRDLADASEFFRADRVGYSPSLRRDRYDGLELEAEHWAVDPLQVEYVRSAFFDDPASFPPGSVTFDCALAMRRTRARWRARPPLPALVPSRGHG